MPRNIPAIIGVSIYPGKITFERTTTSRNDAPASTATDRVRPSSPALDAAYGTAPVPPLAANSDEMLMMHFDAGASVASAAPPRFRTQLRMAARRNAREVSSAPSRFVRRICAISAGSVRGRMVEPVMPAALTRMSTGCCGAQLRVIGGLLWMRVGEWTYQGLFEVALPGAGVGDVADEEADAV